MSYVQNLRQKILDRKIVKIAKCPDFASLAYGQPRRITTFERNRN